MRPVLGGYYCAADDGQLFSIRNDKFLRPTMDRYGYVYYVVSIHGKRITAKAHRLVAQAFIPNPLDKPTVNHKNGKRSDNRVENLEWATVPAQTHDPNTTRNRQLVVQRTDYQAMGARRNFGRKRVAVYDGDALVGVYGSLKIAAAKHETNYSKASECANGRRQMTGGVRFAYIG
jgi:hypothetical protein